jgi:hypothetical protein
MDVVRHLNPTSPAESVWQYPKIINPPKTRRYSHLEWRLIGPTRSASWLAGPGQEAFPSHQTPILYQEEYNARFDNAKGINC